MQKYLLGLDNGGTLVKAALFDFNGVQQATASARVPLLTPHPGFTERNLEAVWQANVECVRGLLAKHPVGKGEVAGISISGHGKGLYMLGAPEDPYIYNGILSTDSRAWEFVHNWNTDGTAEKVYEKTFQGIMAVQPVALLAWFKKHNPDIFKKIRWILSAKDYVRYRLTGCINAEYTDFSGSNLINLNTKEYDPQLLALFGIEEVFEKLPPLKHSAEFCGELTEAAAQEMGLSSGVPVSGGMFDINACGIAAGMIDEEQLCMIAGTWSINEYISKNPVTNKSIFLNSLFCIPDYYLIEESSPTSAGNLEWFIKTFLPGIPYSKLNSMVESISPEDSTLIFLPYLNGSGEDALAKGTFIGMTGYHTQAHMVRAIYEGVVFSHQMHLLKLLNNRKAPKAIRLAGGAAQSEAWVHIFADTLQIPIEIIADVELGCLGAAMVAGIASGIYSDYQQAASKTTKITKTIYPDPRLKGIYWQKYEAFCSVTKALSPIWKHFSH